MPDLPTGTVTFLFTDIEGSTRLWEEQPDAMRAALGRHDAILHGAIEAGGGRLFKTLGDGCCAAFATAPEALAAALGAQRLLQGEAWGELEPLRVRMALYTGIAEERDGDYVGPPRNRAARLLAAGHGGQILLSAGTEQVARDALPDEVSLRDLGSHRLPDLPEAEHVFQVVHPDLPSHFPSLKSLSARPHNLPRPLTSFIGREREIGEAKRLLVGQAVSLPGTGDRQADSLPHCPLLTLTGAGGCGKSRLALRVAGELVEEYADGVWLVEFAGLSDPALVPQSVAAALGVREEPGGRPVLATLTQYLRSRPVLLVLDNCEHLIAACAGLADTLLRACPNLQILATSREPLGTAGETTKRVPSLSVPTLREGSRVRGRGSGVETPGPVGHPSSTLDPRPSTLLEYEAVRLFADRATAVLPAFAITDRNGPAVARVCARLDGIPLAIELAAARVRVLTVEQIAARMSDSFHLLTGGRRTALPRHQTLRAAIDWSYDLLSERERTLLRRLSVFAGGFTLEAAEGVCGDDQRPTTNDEQGISDHATRITHPATSVGRWSLVVGRDEVLDLLTALVDKSLVVAEEGNGEARYRLLETVRQYARERLVESGEVAAIRRRHTGFFLTLAQEVAPEPGGSHQRDQLDRLEVEHDNVRVALAWTIEVGASADERPAVEHGLRAAAALFQFWLHRGHLTEGRSRVADLLALPAAAEPTSARARALYVAGWQANDVGEFAESERLFEESLAISRAVDDKWGIAASLRGIAWRTTDRLPFDERKALCEEGLRLFRELGDELGIADTLRTLGVALRARGDRRAAQAHLEESLAINRKLNDRVKIAMSLESLGIALLEQGDEEPARRHFEESLAIYREMDSPMQIARLINRLGGSASHRGDWQAARQRFEESLAIYRELGSPLQIAQVLSGLGYAMRDQGDWEAARCYLEESLRLFEQIGNKETSARLLCSLGALAVHQSDGTRAKACIRQALALAREVSHRMLMASCLERAAAVMREEGRAGRAARLLGAVAVVREDGSSPAVIPDRTVLDREVAATRACLGEEAFVAAWAEGQAMTLDAAVAHALEELRSGGRE